MPVVHWVELPVCSLLDVGVFPTIVHALAEEVMSVEVLLGFGVYG